MPVWDFDLRVSSWENGKSKKGGLPKIIDTFYLLLGLENNEPSKLFLMPAMDIKTTHIRIPVSGKSKYYKYVI
jgi:hypothetical protein